MSTQTSVVRYAVDGAVATITLDRPDAMNSFNQALRVELTEALSQASSDNSVRAVVLTGEGRAFSAGADLTAGFPEDKTVEAQLQREYRPAFNEIVTMPKPVIAAVNGAAAGIGMSFALAADLAVMGENAFLLAPFSTISLVPDGGANWFLQKALGYKRAFQLAVEAERIDAKRCLEWGLVNRVVDDAQVLDEAQGWAATLADRAPLSIKATKRAMRHAEAGSWSSTFDLEAEIQTGLVGSEDNVEGVAAFFEKRKAIFKGN
ncbi:MAG: enoyl-CoA hydratase-related protein [Pseudomonadota bacterium]